MNTKPVGNSAKVSKLRDLDREIPMVKQDRAYASPICYNRGS